MTREAQQPGGIAYDKSGWKVADVVVAAGLKSAVSQASLLIPGESAAAQIGLPLAFAAGAPLLEKPAAALHELTSELGSETVSQVLDLAVQMAVFHGAGKAVGKIGGAFGESATVPRDSVAGIETGGRPRGHAESPGGTPSVATADIANPHGIAGESSSGLGSRSRASSAEFLQSELGPGDAVTTPDLTFSEPGGSTATRPPQAAEPIAGVESPGSGEPSNSMRGKPAGRRSGGGEPEYPIIKRPRAYENAKFREGELEIHFDKHKAEYGGLGKDGYLKRAQDLLGEDVGGEILGHTRANGEVVRFNTRTGEWACGRPDGSIKTLFRPLKHEGSTPLDYYLNDKASRP